MSNDPRPARKCHGKQWKHTNTHNNLEHLRNQMKTLEHIKLYGEAWVITWELKKT